MASTAGSLLLSHAAAALAAAPPTPPALVLAPVKVELLQWRDRTLTNGLRVLSSASQASPTVSVQVWYRVGGKDDPAGRSGFAHLFEHMMFKSTRYLAAEQFDRLTEDVGGSNTASTQDDVTEFHEVVPSNHLERLLWAEAERMANLDVDEANFTSERAVVEQEFRQRILAAPYGRLDYAVESNTFRVHPYKRPVIGSIAELDAATLDDVRRFHATYYRPDNAVLVVTGDFEAAQLDAWVDRYFGPLPRPAAPIPRVTALEPPWPDDRRLVVEAPGVPLPAVALCWLGPPANDADAQALGVVEALLAGGESARLNQALVYRDQIASQATFSYDGRADAGLLTANAIAARGTRLDRVATALLAQIARLATVPVGAAELDKVKAQLLTQALIERQTPVGLGSALGYAATVEGDPARVNTGLAALQAVTAADVQRVVRRWLVGAHQSRIDYVAQKEPAATAKGRP
jgi:zinc protease